MKSQKQLIQWRNERRVTLPDVNTYQKDIITKQYGIDIGLDKPLSRLFRNRSACMTNLNMGKGLQFSGGKGLITKWCWGNLAEEKKVKLDLFFKINEK